MTDLININTASAEIIATLPNIGTTLAERIVTYRNEVRVFAEPIELVAVNGISARMVQEIAPLITVADRDTTPVASSPPLVPPPAPALEVAQPSADSSVPTDMEEVREREVEPVVAVSSAAVSPPRQLAGWQLAGIGALAGMLLTLALLAILNDGTLTFNSRSQVEDVQMQLETLVVQQATLQNGVERARADSADSRQTISTLEAEVDDNIGAVFQASEGIVVFLEGMENIVGTLNPEQPTAPPTESTEEPTPTPTPRPTRTPDSDPTVTPRRTTRPTATPIGTPDN